MESDTRTPRGDPDGVRTVEIGRSRRAARARILVGVAVATVAAVVALTAAAVAFLRHDTRIVGGSPTPVEQQVAAQPNAPVVVRAIPKVPAAHVQNAPTPGRRGAMSRRERAAGTTPNQLAGAADRGVVTDRAVPADRAAAPNAGNDAAVDSAADEQRNRQLESLARDVIEGLKATGETGGLAAFPPPGTVPIKVGLVVPDGFELPEGYMRYYQNTDEGQRLEPILMFSPDYQFVDANGNAVALPKDGVVPPEMAPPGMPQRTLQLPNARTAGSGSSQPGS